MAIYFSSIALILPAGHKCPFEVLAACFNYLPPLKGSLGAKILSNKCTWSRHISFSIISTLSTHIVFSRFLLFLIFSLQKILFADIWARTLCDTCNSISYVLYFLWHYLFLSFNCPPILFFVVTARSQPYYTKSESFCLLLIGKPLPNHATMAWFYYTIKTGMEACFYF